MGGGGGGGVMGGGIRDPIYPQQKEIYCELCCFEGKLNPIFYFRFHLSREGTVEPWMN